MGPLSQSRNKSRSQWAARYPTGYRDTTEEPQRQVRERRNGGFPRRETFPS